MDRDISSHPIGFSIESLRTKLDQHRSLIVFVVVLHVLVGMDVAFRKVVIKSEWAQKLLGLTDKKTPFPVDFAPEVWLAVLALVLGTLVIVISISSQSVPKLIDFYSRDWLSLCYLWFILLALTHNLYLQFSAMETMDRMLSILLNTYFFLPAALILSMPYIIYILNNTQTSTVIEKIYKDHLGRLFRLADPATSGALEIPSVTANYQRRLFESLNQFDDLLHYTPFKEPKASMMSKIGEAIMHYVEIKSHINPGFFKVSGSTRADISFLTITDQWQQIEKTRVFYELKGFRILSNHYAKLLQNNEFDLACLCASQFVDVARVAGEQKDSQLLKVITIQFNTLIRYAIKHGNKANEARHIYNLLFFYRQFVLDAAAAGQVEVVEQSCNYLQHYSSEIFRYSLSVPAFVFLVDVCVAEMRTILEHLAASDWPREDQKHVLDLMLKMDDTPIEGYRRSDALRTRSAGVRVIQLGLALFYLEQGQNDFVTEILTDVVDPDSKPAARELGALLRNVLYRLRNAPETFWEDTDRGNRNIYFSAFTDKLPELMMRFQKLVEQHYPEEEAQIIKAVMAKKSSNGSLPEVSNMPFQTSRGLGGRYRQRRTD